MPSYLGLPLPSPIPSTASSYTLVSSPTDPNDFSDLQSKSPPQQLEVLSEMLVVQNRIKEGAQNLLNMRDLADVLREQVMSELDMAQNKIESIQRRMEQLTETKAKTNHHVSGSTRKKFLAGQSARPGRDDVEDKSGEDFRTALGNASTCIKSLAALARGNVTSPVASSAGSSSSAPAPISAADIDRQRVEIITKLVSILQRNLRVRYELNLADVMQAVIPALADKASQKCRAAAYRLIRHTLIDADSMKRIGEQTLDWYMIKSLTRDNKHTMEKEQVIKLIRTIVEVGTVRNESRGRGTVPLSGAVMRAFVAVAEHAEDPFRLICIQTLAEILVIDTDLVARTGGMRFLLHALGEGPLEVAPLLASVFLHIVDSPRTRAYLQVGADLEMALSAVTDAYGKGPDHADRMRGCTKVIQLMLRSWSGLMYFCMDNMRAIRSLIDTLRIPSLDTREIILDMFFDLLNIKTPEWYQTFIDGRRLTMYRKTREARERRAPVEQPPERTNQTLKLTDQYIALMVLVFTNAGLLDALTGMMEESTSGSNLSRKATLLMAEVLQMANRVLPLSIAAQIQTIPRIFSMASDYSHGENRIVGTSAMSAIDSFNRNQTRLDPNAVKGSSRPRANSADDAIRRGQRQIEQVKLKMSMQMDDKTFQASLLETQVMLTKDHTVWKFDLLQELIEGPLLNPKRLEEAIKVSRFIRRLLSFFHPFGSGIKFCDLPRTKVNHRWVKLGCSLLTTLTSSPDGVRYLSTEDPFLAQIVKSFAQLDPSNAVPDSDPVFSKRRVSDRLTYGYLVMLGTLSRTKDGIELLQKFKIFTAFYHLSELKDREDLVKGIIENLDYNIDGHSRIVLSKTLTSSFPHIRLYATRHLGDLIRGSPTANAWTLRLLVTQLYDPEPEVCELAVTYLRDACESKDILQLVVEMQPTMDHLGEIGHPLLLKFISTPVGFRYLYDVGYINQEMDTWFHERNIYYVVQVEVFLAKVFSSSSASDHEEALAFDGTVPPHFYGEMAKTDLGCQILQEKGHFAEFAEFIRRHSNESDDSEVILKLKSILWAVGNIGATEGGLPFLEEEEIIPTVLDIAQNSLIPSVRGTCFFVLGLISSTSQGAEILDDYRWEATLSPLGLPTGLCIPVDLDMFISIPPWTQQSADKSESRLIPPTSQTELDVITAIHNLANTVIANAASRSLARMKARPEFKSIFASPVMFFRALHTVSTQRYRLPVRRYIVDLFTIELDAEVVAAITDAARTLKASPSFKPSKETNRVSMFGPLGRPRRSSESDDEGEIDVDDEPQKPPVGVEQPVLSLRPVTRTVGFDI
ncbi:Rapamycin-insensitive companion of mTOR, N-term-domain-containing protein [Mycena alexandri]|uniref:Rapamycin-insensitive companion of mTOR, N-term-domain-containing protein n=1 Tax=Mycena alexandri TaxID=1745969 RepID=A0AAD6TFE5_9AGAR|nr:Rapamycin-insensitive companion of mTOR, N-term-domain-containing protein [Mycena alexandri]